MSQKKLLLLYHGAAQYKHLQGEESSAGISTPISTKPRKRWPSQETCFLMAISSSIKAQITCLFFFFSSSTRLNAGSVKPGSADSLVYHFLMVDCAGKAKLKVFLTYSYALEE
ncbi:uncharacterized protein LOC143463269 [Clavelina lepadiformis]|uniref:uncharacterized protein LOC143463269 n=1 Tax=Clavelina lepadiformis TaxID=159417 RepID=UPI004042410C